MGLAVDGKVDTKNYPSTRFSIFSNFCFA